MKNDRQIIRDGDHTTEIINILSTEINHVPSIVKITEKAASILLSSVDPIGGIPESPSDGLLYGLIQSGKTSVITVTAGMAADNGFQNLIILTSDNNILYEQTLNRVKMALRGLSTLGKNDWNEPERFARQLHTLPFAIVCSKNSSMLDSLLNAYKKAKAQGLSTLIIDDEADQASLNTKNNKKGADPSSVNRAISEIRDYFPVNTYLQVTATPQALFLQKPDGRYRPSFTVLSEPGPGYVGGDAFFNEDSKLLKYVDIEEIESIHSTHQPSPTGKIPLGLFKALCSYLIGATYKIIEDPQKGGSAFLCHVHHTKIKHSYLVNLLDQFKQSSLQDLLENNESSKTITFLRDAYNDLLDTQPDLPNFEDLLKKISFYLPGTNIKLINDTSKDQITLDGVYNLFVGGNKLGRGVTIKNLLVSYYGRNAKRPNSDTVLQHARMYGYRQKDIGITRLFLPRKLADHFRSIHQMESALREIILEYPDGKFEGIFIKSPLQATRRNVLDPDSIGVYAAGKMYNSPYPLRTEKIKEKTEKIDELLKNYKDQFEGEKIDNTLITQLLELCPPDNDAEPQLWNFSTLKVALETINHIYKGEARLVVQRGRNITAHRGESQGIHSGGEDKYSPTNVPVLFMYRMNATKEGQNEVWWPQLRFPQGNYVLAFSFE